MGHDEAHSREQLALMMLHLRNHLPRRLPTGRLVQEAFVSDDRCRGLSSRRTDFNARRQVIKKGVGHREPFSL